jgi:TonB family protein
VRLRLTPALLTAALMTSGLASTSAQTRAPERWLDSTNTAAFAFVVSATDADVVHVTLRAGSRVAQISSHAADVKRFGDSAAVILSRAPWPARGAPDSLGDAKMRLVYSRSDRGDVVRLTITGARRVEVEPTMPEALRVIGILRRAAFWAAEQRRLAAGLRSQPTPAAGIDTYLGEQVDRQASPRPGNSPPAYPDPLRKAKVEGVVLAQFVVDTLGRADMSTFKVLKSTHELFAQSVRSALARYRFSPAELSGRKVKQLIQMPFDFGIDSSN